MAMTLGSHQTAIGRSQVHITPKRIIDALGPFDLDPAAANPRPWDCAAVNYTEADDGLRQRWHGRVWLNPPFDQYKVGKFIRRLAAHGCGIALLHARTETDWFLPIWQQASGILFMADRIKFCRPDGVRRKGSFGAPAERHCRSAGDRLAMARAAHERSAVDDGGLRRGGDAKEGDEDDDRLRPDAKARSSQRLYRESARN
jgi:hypothetical protein